MYVFSCRQGKKKEDEEEEEEKGSTRTHTYTQKNGYDGRHSPLECECEDGREDEGYGRAMCDASPVSKTNLLVLAAAAGRGCLPSR